MACRRCVEHCAGNWSRCIVRKQAAHSVGVTTAGSLLKSRPQAGGGVGAASPIGQQRVYSMCVSADSGILKSVVAKIIGVAESKQKPHNGSVPATGCEVKRAPNIAGVNHLCARISEEQPHDLHMAVSRSKRQRLPFSRCWIHSGMTQQKLDNIDMPARASNAQRKVAVCCHINALVTQQCIQQRSIPNGRSRPHCSLPSIQQRAAVRMLPWHQCPCRDHENWMRF